MHRKKRLDIMYSSSKRAPKKTEAHLLMAFWPNASRDPLLTYDILHYLFSVQFEVVEMIPRRKILSYRASSPIMAQAPKEGLFVFTSLPFRRVVLYDSQHCPGN